MNVQRLNEGQSGDWNCKGSIMNEVKTKERVSKPVQTRQIKVGRWNDSLKTSDVNQIWIELHRIVSSHPLVRASKRAGFLVEEGKQNAYTDLTQEIFVALLSKDRFQHYIDTAMSDAEIEAEISQIELTNMLTAELRKRYPESYRLARRVSTLIQTSAAFKRFDNIDNQLIITIVFNNFSFQFKIVSLQR